VQGEWVHPKIANPDYTPNNELYAYADSSYIGFDLWQVKSGTIFDSILITDDLEVQATAAAAFKTQSEV
jgi:calreticulin